MNEEIARRLQEMGRVQAQLSAIGFDVSAAELNAIVRSTPRNARQLTAEPILRRTTRPVARIHDRELRLAA